MALSTLSIILDANLDKLSKSLKNAQQKLKVASDKLSSIGSDLSKKVTAPIVAVGAALFATSVKAGRMADELLDLSAQTGMSTRTLQEYRNVATQAGIDTDAFANAAKGLQRRLDAGGQETEGFTRATEALGVSIRDANGNFRSMDDMLADATEALAGITDPIHRNTLGMELFGRQWEAIAPAVNDGVEAMRRARAEAHVIDDAALERANEFRKQWDNVKQSLGHVATKLGIAVLPVMKQLAGMLENHIIPRLEQFVDWVGRLDPKLMGTIAIVAGLVVAIGPLVLMVGKLIAVLAFLISPIGLVVAGIALLGTAVVAVVRHWDWFKLQAAKIWDYILRMVHRAIDGILAGYEKFMGWIPIVGDGLKELRAQFQEFSNDTLANSAERVRRLTEELEANRSKTEEVTDESKNASESLRDFNGTTLTNVTNEVNGVIDALRRLDDRMRVIRVSNDLLGDRFDALSEEASALRAAMESLATEGIDASDERMVRMAARYDEIRQEQERLEQSTNTMANAQRIFNGIMDAAQTPAERLAEIEGQLGILYSANKITMEEYFTAIQRVTSAMEDAEKPAGELGTTIERMANRGTDAIADFATGSRNAIRSFVDDAIRQLARLAARTAALRLGGLLLGGPVGLALSNITGRAHGGPIAANRPYLVHQDEVIIPKTASQVINARDAGMERGSVTLSVSVPPATNPIVMARDNQWQMALKESIRVAKDNGFRM